MIYDAYQDHNERNDSNGPMAAYYGMINEE